MNESGFTLRKATEADIPVILTFIRELAAYEKALHEVKADEALLQKTLFGPDAKTEAVIGYEADTPVGFALFFYNFSTWLGRPGIYLEDLYIRPDFRGKGYGRNLLHYLAQLAVAQNCGRLEWSVLDWNQPAIDFYQSIGAKPMHEWVIYRLTGEALESFAARHLVNGNDTVDLSVLV